MTHSNLQCRQQQTVACRLRQSVVKYNHKIIGGEIMETKDIILELRTKKGLSQEELAEKIFVTRQAVSRWETGETIPNTETLKLLSKEFDVSIHNRLPFWEWQLRSVPAFCD